MCPCGRAKKYASVWRRCQAPRQRDVTAYQGRSPAYLGGTAGLYDHGSSAAPYGALEQVSSMDQSDRRLARCWRCRKARHHRRAGHA